MIYDEHFIYIFIYISYRKYSAVVAETMNANTFLSRNPKTKIEYDSGFFPLSSFFFSMPPSCTSGVLCFGVERRAARQIYNNNNDNGIRSNARTAPVVSSMAIGALTSGA